MKHAQKRRCTSSICEQSLGKVWMKMNKNFWSYRLHKLGTPKVLRTAKCLSSTPLQNAKKIMKGAQNRRCTSSICEQSFGKVWMKRDKNFWSYRLHKLGTPKVLRTAKCLSSKPLKNEKKIMKRAQNRRCTSSICEQSFGKVWMKRDKNFWSYRLHKLGTPKVLRTAKCLSSKHLKNEKKIMKHAQKRRCTSSICEQSFGKVWMKRNKNFWSYRLLKLGTPKVFWTDGRTDRRTDGRTDGRSGPITRPAFAKATQVKIYENFSKWMVIKLRLQVNNIKHALSHTKNETNQIILQSFNSFLASGDFCCLMITFANSVDPDLDQQNVGPIFWKS